MEPALVKTKSVCAVCERSVSIDMFVTKTNVPWQPSIEHGQTTHLRRSLPFPLSTERLATVSSKTYERPSHSSSRCSQRVKFVALRTKLNRALGGKAHCPHSLDEDGFGPPFFGIVRYWDVEVGLVSEGDTSWVDRCVRHKFPFLVTRDAGVDHLRLPLVEGS